MNVYVSLTTVKQNEARVVETLQSIAAQTQLPDKCFILLIKKTCPTGNDVWFNFMRIANGISCHSDNLSYMTKDNTNQQTSLWSNFNAINRTNSKYMRATIDLLISEGLLTE